MENEGQGVNLDEEISELPDFSEDEELDYDSLQEKYKESLKMNKTLFAQKNHFKSKLEKASEKKEVSKKEEPKPKSTGLEEKVSALEMAEQKRQFGYEHKLSPEETDYVFRFAGTADPKEALEHPFVKSGLDALRTQKKVAEATPKSGSSSSGVYQGKKLTELTPLEKQKMHEEDMKKRFGKG